MADILIQDKFDAQEVKSSSVGTIVQDDYEKHAVVGSFRAVSMNHDHIHVPYPTPKPP